MSTRTFCCCLPVRLGVFVLSALQTLSGGASAGLLWFEYIKNPNLTTFDKWVFFGAAIYYSILTAAALFGFVGAISRKRGLVVLYSTFLYISLVLSLVAGGFLCYLVFNKDSSVLFSDCVTEVNNADNNIPNVANINVSAAASQACHDVLAVSKWAYIVNLVITFLIQLYCAYIVSSYVRQLSDEQSFRAVNKVWTGPVAPTGYYPHQPLDQTQQGLLQPTGGYPYSDPHNSFGPKLEA